MAGGLVNAGLVDGGLINAGLVDGGKGGAAAGYVSSFSLAFDGAGDWVNFGSAFPDLDGVCSISLWVKFNTVTGNQALVWDTLATGQVSIYMGSGNMAFLQTSGSGIFFGGGGSNAVVADTWYHMLFVRTGSTGNWSVNLWTNGTADTNNPRTIIPDPAASPTGFRFGYANDVGGFSLDGFLDEIAVWTSDQSSNVAGLADGSIDPASLSPVGFWRFEEGSGTNVNDEGSGNNDGTITNATYDADVPAALA